MQEVARRRLKRASSVFALAASGALVAACAMQPEAAVTPRHKEYFSEAVYGVKASPRVAEKGARVARGGGREQVGDPYLVKGRWYYPKAYKHYSKVGAASWYGSAFDGRLTANGEVYDQNYLSAASPTLPLPCYARVTNLANGSSVVVRVNDRGPFEAGRLIDLSRRAAEVLHYKDVGVARVKVDYLGNAPLDGNDERYLMASYRPGPGMPKIPGQGLPDNVMIAMNGPTPISRRSAVARAFPGVLTSSGSSAIVVPSDPEAEATVGNDGVTLVAVNVVADGDPVLPAAGPIAPERPDFGVTAFADQDQVSILSYADQRVRRASSPFDALMRRDGERMTPKEIVASWKREKPGRPARGDRPVYVLVGAFSSADAAARQAARLERFGRPEVETAALAGRQVYSVSLYPDGRASIDAMLREAWAGGASGAMTVRE